MYSQQSSPTLSLSPALGLLGLLLAAALALASCADAKTQTPSDATDTAEQELDEQSPELDGDELDTPEPDEEDADAPDRPDPPDQELDHHETEPDEADEQELPHTWVACTHPLSIPEHLLLEEQFNEELEHDWVRVERWHDNRELYPVDDYVPDGRNDQRGEMETLFGSPTPPSSSFLLHYAPGWDALDRSEQAPVLLVHGTASNADHSWADPGVFGYCGALSCPDEGLMQFLASQGKRVFAVSFAQMQGDNIAWAEQIANAVAIVRERTGSPDVDLIAWSKGGFATQLFVSGLELSDNARMADCVQKLIFIGTPHKGLDYPFRYGILPSTGIYTMCGVGANAPSPHTMMTCYFVPYQQPELTIYATEEGDFYPGQRQMLYRWDELYPVSTINQDYYTTYYGGLGFVSESLGIDAAIEQGSLVAGLLERSIPSHIQVYSLCGGAADIPLVLNETAGPSDGVLLLDSCSYHDNIPRLAEAFVDEELNHFELGWAESAMLRIDGWLDQPWE